MINRYDELEKRQQEEFNKFPIAYAFSEKQFAEGLKKLGLTENDKDKVVGTIGGGFIKKEDVSKYKELGEKFARELKEKIENDITGKEFIKDMFTSELANHEYGYTRKLEETLDALGITIDEINSKPNLKNGLKLALEEYERDEEEL